MHITLTRTKKDNQLIAHKFYNLVFDNHHTISKTIKDYSQIHHLTAPTLLHKNKIKKYNQPYKKSLDTCQSAINIRKNSGENLKIHSQDNPEHTQHIHFNQQNRMNQNRNVYVIKWRKSPIINRKMRIILIDWLMELSAQLNLTKKVLQNAIYFTDKFVHSNNIQKQDYQIIGLSSLFLASKLEQSSHLKIDYFIEAMNFTCSKAKIIQIQQKIVKNLKYKLNPPTFHQQMTLLLQQFKQFQKKYHFINSMNLALISKTVFWMVDGVIMNQEVYTWSKQKICFSILYLTLKRIKGQQDTKIVQNINRCKLQVGFQSFMSFINRQNTNIGSIIQCVNELLKWSISQCRCDGKNVYHPQLKQIALRD